MIEYKEERDSEHLYIDPRLAQNRWLSMKLDSKSMNYQNVLAERFQR